MKVLDLVLKHKWYDMIESGEKKEEYREDKEYWIKRLTDFQLSFVPNHFRRGERVAIPHKDFTYVRFHKGYTSTTMLFELQGIEFGFGNSSWGAPDKEVFILKLGSRID